MNVIVFPFCYLNSDIDVVLLTDDWKYIQWSRDYIAQHANAASLPEVASAWRQMV